MESALIENLRKAVKDSGMSQNKVAAKAGLTTQRLSNILNQRGIIHPEEIEALAGALGVSIAALFGKEASNEAVLHGETDR